MARVKFVTQREIYIDKKKRCQCFFEESNVYAKKHINCEKYYLVKSKFQKNLIWIKKERCLVLKKKGKKQ